MQPTVLANNYLMTLWRILPPFMAVAVIGCGSVAFARDYKISGGLTTGYERYDRRYDTDTNEEAGEGEKEQVSTTTPAEKDDEYDRLRLSPLITISSVSARDELMLRYQPSFRYDMESSDHDIDQDLKAELKYSLTRDWLLKVSERYVLTDENIQNDSTLKSESIQLSDNEERRQYWNNELGFVSEYKYLEDSIFSLGYTFGKLENIDVEAESDYENYDRHSVMMSVGHRFDSIWKLTASTNYVRGLYEIPEEEETTETDEAILDKDLSEYRASTSLESRLIEHNPLSLAYSFAAIDYDAEEEATITLHDITAGWQCEFSKELTLKLGGGPSFQQEEGQNSNWGYNANGSVRYGFERGAFELSANRGYDVQNFTGTDENGLREFWQARFAFDYLVIENLSFKIFTTYRDEDQEEITEQRAAQTDAATETTSTEALVITETDVFNRQQLGAGTSLGYKFARWYSINLAYNYLQQDSEKTDDSYDEHRLVLSLSVEKDLLNW